jgi:small nuclear ribonucleoprotein (snRNP)-like protein
MCWTGCHRPYSYTYYEVVQSPNQLKVGDNVQISARDGSTLRGALIRVDQTEVIVTTEGRGKKRITWAEILVIKRFERTVE